MDFEQLMKRMDWLDEERRKDKITLSALEEQIKGLEVDLRMTNKKIKEFNPLIAKVNIAPGRLDQLEMAINRQRTELLDLVDTIQHQQEGLLQDADKRYQMQFDGLSKVIAATQKYKSSIADLKREIKAHADEEPRHNKLMAEWEARIQKIINLAENVEQTQRISEESRKKETKRLTDLALDLGIARKRLDEVREKNEVFTDGLRRVELRINELLVSESERRQAQVSFIETQSRLQVERDRAWKEWEESLKTSSNQLDNIERALQDWDVAQRAIKRSQDTYDDIVLRFERRINEISEMQRLAEDRFRQEWVTFKADDQKRWTSYTLSQEEVRKDFRLTLEKLHHQITSLEDSSQTQQDVLQQTKDANEQLFQGMLSQIHELLSSYERIMSKK